MIKDVRMHTLCRNLAFDNEATCQVIRVFTLFVCLSVCLLRKDYSKNYQPIFMKLVARLGMAQKQIS